MGIISTMIKCFQNLKIQCSQNICNICSCSLFLFFQKSERIPNHGFLFHDISENLECVVATVSVPFCWPSNIGHDLFKKSISIYFSTNILPDEISILTTYLTLKKCVFPLQIRIKKKLSFQIKGLVLCIDIFLKVQYYLASIPKVHSIHVLIMFSPLSYQRLLLTK